MEIRVLALSNRPDSLRQAIWLDLSREKHPTLRLLAVKDFYRLGGWSKAQSLVNPGVVNFDWDPVGKILTVRAITRGNKPDAILGEFVGYLFEKFGSRITTIVNAGKAGK
jgi:hypothetical protein